MTNKRVSELVEAISVNDTDLLPLVQDGVTKKVSKQVLDSFSKFGQVSRSITHNQISTTDATPTVILSSGDVPTDRDAMLEVSIQVRSGTLSNIYKRTLHIKNVSNVVTVALEQFDFTNEQLPDFNISFSINTLSIECSVVGAAATTAVWTGLAIQTTFA